MEIDNRFGCLVSVAMWLALAVTIPAHADENMYQYTADGESFFVRGVTETGYRTFLGVTHSHRSATGLTWCGNDVLIYVSGRVGDGMFHDGDLHLMNVETGEQRIIRGDIFKFVDDIFFDFPKDYGGDWNGIFEVWPMACSPDGEWLFYRDESYDSPVSMDDRRYSLRALNLATGQDHQLSQSRSEILSVTPSPDGRELFVVYSSQDGIRYQFGEWSGEPPVWKPVDLPADYRYYGWRNNSGGLVAVAKDESDKFPSGFYEISATEKSFLPLTLPPLYQEWVETSGPRAGHIRIKDVRQNRIVGHYDIPTPDRRSHKTIFFSCAIEGQAWSCRETELLKAGRSYFIWSRDGESVFYEGKVPTDSEEKSPGGIIRYNLATGENTFIASAGFVGDLSPNGEKLIMSYQYGYPKILFLQPLPQ